MGGAASQQQRALADLQSVQIDAIGVQKQLADLNAKKLALNEAREARSKEIAERYAKLDAKLRKAGAPNGGADREVEKRTEKRAEELRAKEAKLAEREAALEEREHLLGEQEGALRTKEAAAASQEKGSLSQLSDSRKAARDKEPEVKANDGDNDGDNAKVPDPQNPKNPKEDVGDAEDGHLKPFAVPEDEDEEEPNPCPGCCPDNKNHRLAIVGVSVCVVAGAIAIVFFVL